MEQFNIIILLLFIILFYYYYYLLLLYFVTHDSVKINIKRETLKR